MKGKTFEFEMEGGLKKENDSGMMKEMLGDKGDIVVQALGLRLDDMPLEGGCQNVDSIVLNIVCILL